MEALNTDPEDLVAEQDVRAGVEALEQGDFDEYDAGDIRSLADDIKARGRERLALRRGLAPHAT
jgi:hypothetical protein